MRAPLLEKRRNPSRGRPRLDGVRASSTSMCADPHRKGEERRFVGSRSKHSFRPTDGGWRTSPTNQVVKKLCLAAMLFGGAGAPAFNGISPAALWPLPDCSGPARTPG
jgi:hypothetical protein